MNVEEIREKSIPGDDSRYLGWICSYTPEELLLAAGFIPYRLLSAPDLSSGSEAYLSPNLCPYVHRLFSAGLQGRYEFLSGTVFVLSCDAMRRLSDIWHLYLDSGFVYNLDVPRRRDHLALRWILDQNIQIALWGARHPEQLSPLQDIFGWNLTSEDMEEIDAILAQTITDPVGPDFMAPPDRK